MLLNNAQHLHSEISLHSNTHHITSTLSLSLALIFHKLLFLSKPAEIEQLPNDFAVCFAWQGGRQEVPQLSNYFTAVDLGKAM